MKKVMLKIVETVKKHDNIFVIAMIFLSIFGITLNVFIIDSDELWNFQNVYKIYNGFQIYQDANVIVTPLFFWMGQFLFKILGANFLTFRIYNIIIMILIYFITYLILKKLKVDKRIAIIILLIFLKHHTLVLAQANYNTMALMLSLLGIFLFIKKNQHHSIIQGIILFLIFCTKQNIGVFYAIGLLTYEILSENNLKEKIKNLLIEFGTFFVFLSLLILYFYKTNCLYPFINFTVLGIKEFANENISINIPNLILIVFLIVINLVLTRVFIKNKKVNQIQKQQLLILNCFAIPAMLTVVPILNDVHFLIAMHISMILFISLISVLIKEINLKINPKILNSIIIVLLFLCIKDSVLSFISWNCTINSENYVFQNNSPFYGGIGKLDLINHMDTMIEYVENNPNEVIVLSSKAAFYMVPTKRSNGMMDLPFKGNLGKGGETGLIEQIKNMNHVEILIEKEEENINWQESKKVRQYIIENMNSIGEIEGFIIYTK